MDPRQPYQHDPGGRRWPGGAADLSLATGGFAMQSTWANDASNGSGGCEFSHTIVSNG